MNEIQARDEICRMGKSLFNRGYVHATAGNISMRFDDGFLMTPTDACLGFLDPATLAKVSSQGEQISGQRASKTLALHRRIYEASHAAGQSTHCVIHTHSTHLVALSLQPPSLEGLPGYSELLRPITPYFVMKVGHVPLLPYHRPGAPEVAVLAEEVIAAYAAQGLVLHALMQSRLGPIVWHQSPASAMATLEELEETARLTLLCPNTEALSETSIEQLRKQFDASW